MNTTLHDFTVTHRRVARRSPAFTLTLRLHGQPVAVVSNDGRGGADRWHAPPSVAYTTTAAARQLLRTLAKAISESRSDAESAIIAAMADGAKNGADAAQMYIEFMQEHSNA